MKIEGGNFNPPNMKFGSMKLDKTLFTLALTKPLGLKWSSLTLDPRTNAAKFSYR